MSQNEKRRRAAFAKIGETCVCCAETNLGFLTLDHIENDGSPHREEVADMYSWAIRDPNAHLVLQTLCANCNFGRQWNGGSCPHGKKFLGGVPASVAEAARKATREKSHQLRSAEHDEMMVEARSRHAILEKQARCRIPEIHPSLSKIALESMKWWSVPDDGTAPQQITRSEAIDIILADVMKGSQPFAPAEGDTVGKQLLRVN